MNGHLQGIKAFPAIGIDPGEGGHVPDNAAEKEILAVLKAEWAAFYRSDFKEFAHHWVHGPQVRRTICGPHCGTLITVGWDRISVRLREGMRRFPQNFMAEEWLRWDNLQVQAGTDMAWVSYDQVAIKHNPHIQASGLQHETKILHRVDGEWKLVCLLIVVPGIGRDDTPQIELDRNGRVFRINALAHDRLQDHPGLIVSAGRVRARNRQFDAGLQSEIKRVLTLLNTTLPPDFFRQRAVEAVSLGEDDFGHPIYCWVMLEQERLLVTFDDAYLMQLRLDLAAELFSLSPAQHRLAKLLAEGTNLARAAEELGVSVNTLRTQLRRMFEKTGTRNQPALISALLSVQRPT